MSHVSSMVVTCELSEEDDDGGLGEFHAWCAEHSIRFGRLDDAPAVCNSKAMEVLVLACAANYFDEHALIEAFPTFPWLFPEDAVLVIHPQHGTARIVTGNRERHDIRERAQKIVDEGDENVEAFYIARHILDGLARDR